MNWTAIIVPIVIGLGINEYAEFAPWIARKIVRRAARRMYAGDAERAEIRAEEWAAIIDARPGKLFKLMSALGYGVAAVLTATRSRERLHFLARLAVLHGLHLSTMELRLLASLFALRLRAERVRWAVKAVLYAPSFVASLYLVVHVAISPELGKTSPLMCFLIPPMLMAIVIGLRLYLMCAVVIAGMALLPGGLRERRRRLTHGRSAIKPHYIRALGLEGRVRRCASCRRRALDIAASHKGLCGHPGKSTWRW